ncbi:MAG: selenium cofactor biosynthesis protein YqeC [Actinobacteria bacterium]|nr:selenium cofactor biosynthesis protein YqeC [Actinomycetota bacterium]
MRLVEALRVGPRRTVAFTGAGGKSTAIARLAAELALQGPVVVTTSSRLALRQAQMAETHLIVQDPSALGMLPQHLAEHRSILITGGVARGEPKWLGLDLSSLEALQRSSSQAGAPLLIEADGARGRSLKAPAAHEPVIPSFADLVVPVIGLDVIGNPLTPEWVHRPERVGAVLGLAQGEPIGPEHVAALIGSSEGGLQGIPQRAEVRILLNKADTPERIEYGRSVARLAVTHDRIQAAVLAAATQDAPVREVYGRVAGIILAAGASKRLGQPKQLVRWRDRSLVGHAVWAALEAGLGPIVVVLGSDTDAIRRELADEPVLLLENPDWKHGQSTSVRVGLDAVGKGVEAVAFLLADMPFVTSEVTKAVVAEHRRTLTPIVAPRAADRWGNPVLFDRSTFPALRELSGDRGGRALFDRYRIAGIPWDPSILFDVDRPEDLRRLRQLE